MRQVRVSAAATNWIALTIHNEGSWGRVGDAKVEVSYTRVKNVHAIKGAKPGLVTVHGGRTVHLRRTPKRLERILAASIEEEGG